MMTIHSFQENLFLVSIDVDQFLTILHLSYKWTEPQYLYFSLHLYNFLYYCHYHIDSLCDFNLDKNFHHIFSLYEQCLENSLFQLFNLTLAINRHYQKSDCSIVYFSFFVKIQSNMGFFDLILIFLIYCLILFFNLTISNHLNLHLNLKMHLILIFFG